MKKAVILAPFWRRPGHVGNSRIDRFVRWLAEDGYQVVMIRAGSRNELRETAWGVELTVRDPLGLYHDPVAGGETPVPHKPNKFVYWLAYWMFNPDPSIMWARAAAANSSVQAAVGDADFILSSSPPESAHVGAWMLARKFNRPHIVDMRDGWLDEPLKPILVNSALRRWLEGRLEARILGNSARVFVTSDVWRDLLCRRLPNIAHKIRVLTNGYPKELERVEEIINPAPIEDGLVLIHAGRFSASDRRRTPDILLTPLLNFIRQERSRGIVRLIGQITVEEMAEIAKYNSQFEEVGWSIECPGSMPRDRLLELLSKASGLLLISASRAAVPSKLFEYIVVRRPILVVTERDSATWQVCERLPQAFLVASGVESSGSDACDFIDVAATPSPLGACPEAFSETALAELFRKYTARL